MIDVTHYMSIRAEPLEPLSLRYSGEHGVPSRGPAAMGIYGHLPLPSTWLGALAYTACATLGKVSDGTLKCNYNLVKELLSCGDFWLRSSYLLIDGEPHVVLDGLLVKLRAEELAKYAAMKLAYVRGLKEEARRLRRGFRSVRSLEFLGIGLVEGYKVPYREPPGLLYVSGLTDYHALGTRRVLLACDLVVESGRGAMGITGIVRLGGERRFARLESSREAPMLESLMKLVENPGYYWLVLISPAILNLRLTTLSTLKPLGMTEIERGLGIEGVEAVVGKLAAIGLGFNEVKRIRRPLMISLPPGSLIKATVSEVESLVERGVGTGKWDEVDLRRLGYGTLALVPAENVEQLLPEDG